MIFLFTEPELYCSYLTQQVNQFPKLFSENPNNFRSDATIKIAGLLELTKQTKIFPSLDANKKLLYFQKV